MTLPDITDSRPILIAGATASGKSDLAMRLADAHGGVIVNADASQVYDCWRIVTARPSEHDEARLPHRLYGHIGWDSPYSAGHWLREITDLLNTERARLIIVGGTGLYFKALTEGLADIPATPPEIRTQGDALSLETLRAELDAQTAGQIDLANRARVQRAWEVLTATGRGLAAWQASTPPPLLPLSDCWPILVDAPKAWLDARIFRRFDQMVQLGALDEIAAMAPHYDPNRPAFRAIGVPELMAHHSGAMLLPEACERASISTRQFAKRQRTWFRVRMAGWHHYDPSRT